MNYSITPKRQDQENNESKICLQSLYDLKSKASYKDYLSMTRSKVKERVDSNNKKRESSEFQKLKASLFQPPKDLINISPLMMKQKVLQKELINSSVQKKTSKKYIELKQKLENSL
mmetsp:Transcript_22621/g.21784  ORF Transcript_22621/g.21784 Transcript_22621/m.21784 type:complete len:116 (-) Transcript_22621:407-754(-)